MRMKKILSIQSAVTYGLVGNSVAAPVITKLGMQPLLVDTISLAAHPGHGTLAGGIPNQAQFNAILEALNTLGALQNISTVVTGYLGNAKQIAPIHSMIRAWQAEQPDSLYILDPVLGDEGRLYVDDDVVKKMQDKLLPMAQIVTPNQFELGLLAGIPVNSLGQAQDAANKILKKNPNLTAVIATGINNAPHGISDLNVNRQNMTEQVYSKRPHGVAGGGDLLTAILSCWLTAGHDLETAFNAASCDAHSIIDHSATDIDIALFDNLQQLTLCC